jgi:hypothetical protein
VTGIELQYMARLWSWPAAQTERVIQVYNDSLSYIGQRVSVGGYADIEHVLYKFLPADSSYRDTCNGSRRHYCT